jgi:hypothetical protein
MTESISLVATLGESLQAKVREGKITLAEVVGALAPTKSEELPEAFSPPLPATITPKVSKALEVLPKQFGGVVPTERRKLTDDELVSILEERANIDTKGIRTIVLNHMDVALEESLADQPEVLAGIERDAEGHYYYAEKVPVGDTGKAFSWEVSDGTSTLSPSKLKELDEQGLIDHAWYLSVTDQVRVVNEQKLLLSLSKDPESVLAAIKLASVPGNKKKGSLYVRNA